ncbi:hypothetical protein [uncultured Prevotella sp.]|uniref:hypothetical protein n=1 Tax=uncultured Prevotella sp. TaxID=159272 RepID=UPI0027E33844|nr:hypothetical protein [uncultured Prevotella sp.]
MKDKTIPPINGYWYFNKTSFNVSNGCIYFRMYTVTKTWRHINSEGWEKYHDEMDLNCILQFETKDELYLDVSTIYRYLSEKKQMDYCRIRNIIE